MGRHETQPHPLAPLDGFTIRIAPDPLTDAEGRTFMSWTVVDDKVIWLAPDLSPDLLGEVLRSAAWMLQRRHGAEVMTVTRTAKGGCHEP